MDYLEKTAVLCYNHNKKNEWRLFILKRYILAFLCIFTMLLLITSCKENDVNSPTQNNVNHEYENKINSTICDEYEEYELLAYTYIDKFSVENICLKLNFSSATYHNFLNTSLRTLEALITDAEFRELIDCI